MNWESACSMGAAQGAIDTDKTDSRTQKRIYLRPHELFEKKNPIISLAKTKCLHQSGMQSVSIYLICKFS